MTPPPFTAAAAEHAVPPVVQFLPIAHDVAAVIRFIGHHDDHCITAKVIETVHNRATETVEPLVPQWTQLAIDAAIRWSTLHVVSVLPSSTTMISCAM